MRSSYSKVQLPGTGEVVICELTVKPNEEIKEIKESGIWTAVGTRVSHRATRPRGPLREPVSATLGEGLEGRRLAGEGAS